jgi:putative ABC transport system permease protein
MTFGALILKNLLRHRVRTLLTAVGIAIGIMTVIALGAVATGARQAAGGMLQSGGSDLLVAQKGASDLTFSSMPTRQAARLDRRGDVAWAHPVLLDVSKVGSNPYFVAFGMRLADLAEAPPPLVAGRVPRRADQVLLGDRGARDLGVGVGGTVEIQRTRFRVAGLFHVGTTWQDGGAYVPLVSLQRAARKPGVVTGAYVRVAAGRDAGAVGEAIEAADPQLVAIAGVDDMAEVDQGIEAIDGLNLAISLLAVGIGAIGVMNTMVMSVFERTREIGILRAVGWRGRRVVRMIVGESIAVCLIAFVVGLGLGALATEAVTLVPAIGAVLEPAYTVAVMVRALVVALVVALVGAAYPAIRAARLLPMEALRHE